MAESRARAGNIQEESGISHSARKEGSIKTHIHTVAQVCQRDTGVN